MPYVPIPKGLTNISMLAQDPVKWVEYTKDGRVYDSGVQLTGNFAHTSGRVTRSGGPRVIIGGKLWRPARAYTRSARSAWWSGTTVLTRTAGATATIGNYQVWQGIPGPSSIWSPCSYLPDSVATTSTIASGNGINTLNANGKNRVATQLLVKAGKRKVNYGAALGESRTTYRMIVQTMIQVLRAFRAVRKGQFRHAAGILGLRKHKLPSSRKVAEHWLALQYGWRPLVNDIYDSCKLLQNGLTTASQLFDVRTSWSEAESKSVPHADFKSSVTDTTVRCGGKLWYRISDATTSYLSQLGLINPAEVAWELLPWSFVIDWFIPVGSFLEAMSARVGITFHDGYYGCKTVNRLRQFGCQKTLSGRTFKSSNLVAGIDITAYVRQPMASLPWPGLYYKSPFSTNHVVNALALLRTQRRG